MCIRDRLYALPAGIISALNRNKWVDYVLRFLSFVGVSMPTFWLGLVLIYIFGLKLGLVPIASSRVTASGVISVSYTHLDYAYEQDLELVEE